MRRAGQHQAALAEPFSYKLDETSQLRGHLSIDKIDNVQRRRNSRPLGQNVDQASLFHVTADEALGLEDDAQAGLRRSQERVTIVYGRVSVDLYDPGASSVRDQSIFSFGSLGISKAEAAVPAELVEGLGLTLRGKILWRGTQNSSPGSEWTCRQIRRVRQRSNPDGGVEAVLSYVNDPVIEHELLGNLGIFPGELNDDGGEANRAEADRSGDPQTAAWTGSHFTSPYLGVIDESQDLQALFLVLRPGLRQDLLTGGAGQQPNPEDAFETSDVVADRGGGHTTPFRRCSEAALFHNADKYLHAGEAIHGEFPERMRTIYSSAGQAYGPKALGTFVGRPGEAA